MEMHKQSTQFDPIQYISKKHYKNQKGGAQKSHKAMTHAKRVAGKLLRHSVFVSTIDPV